MHRHPKAKRLQVIVNLAEQAEQQALSDWGKLQQKLQQEEQQKQQLQDYVNEYQQSISTPGRSQLKGGAIHNALGFISQIEQALQQQQQQLVLLQQQADAAKQHYLQHHSKLQALHNLLEKLNQEYDHQQDKQGQRQADEWANRAAFTARKSR